MKNVNVQYLDILNDILKYGSFKKTRSGNVYSLFDKNIKIDMKDGFPLINTKKLFIRGSIHEILWMLAGDTNIKYLIENNVHIWDDDAYRWYCKIVDEHNGIVEKCTVSDGGTMCPYSKLDKYSKETFIEICLNGLYFNYMSLNDEDEVIDVKLYKYGDLGPVYGKQWRDYGANHIDQIKYLMDLLKNNPDDRRLLCSAWNPSDMNDMALPPCHYAFQLYTRELSFDERVEILIKQNPTIESINVEILDKYDIPKRELSLKWYQRSCDFFLGVPLNISGYALLLCLFAKCTNMTLGTLSGSFGDCHIYEAHVDAVKEQLKRDPLKFKLPQLKLNDSVTNIFDFKIGDIEVINYESYPKISAPLCVG